ncbi:MAG: hypothetical protein K2X93_09860 [Candidatus Obscuribacterales bacterium]|nr:hypothetical protein [Candidatus Obscuribacterales bacterium]
MDKTKTRTSTILTSSAIVAVVLFVLLNVFLLGHLPEDKTVLTKEAIQNSANERKQEGDWVWWITRNYLVEEKNPDLVFMGSSQMGSALFACEASYLNEAIDTVVHRESRFAAHELKDRLGTEPTTFNLSIGGAMASDQFMLAKSLFNKAHKPQLVVIGVNPRDFIDNSMPSASASDPFHYLSPYVELGDLNQCAFPDAIGWMDWQLNHYVATKALGEKIRTALPKAVLSWLGESEAKTASLHTVSDKGEVLAQEGKTTNDNEQPLTKDNLLKAIYGSTGNIRPGLWKVIACTWGAFQDNTEEYRSRYRDSSPPIYSGQKRFFEQLLAYLKAEDVSVLVVGMPSLWPNRALLPDKFWAGFREYLATSTTKYGAAFIDLSDDARFDSKDYLDTVHLNSTGGTRLVKIVAEKISSEKKLASALTDQTLARKSNRPDWQ